jgi:hypothetical protein
VDGCGWMWMDVDGCGWMWMDVDQSQVRPPDTDQSCVSEMAPCKVTTWIDETKHLTGWLVDQLVTTAAELQTGKKAKVD